MNIKKLLVSFVMLVSILFLVSTVSANNVANSTITVEVNGINVADSPAIIAGEIVRLRVLFTSDISASDITVRAEIEGDRSSVRAQTDPFDVEEGHSYAKILSLEVPFDLRNKLSGDVDLNIRISGSGYRTDESYTLRVQREPYNLDVLSASVPQTVKAGENFPVDFVLRNIGYNDLSDLFVTVRISALDIERTYFFGNLVALEYDKKKDTASGRIFLQIPYDAEPGIYALEVRIKGEDTVSSEVIQLIVENQFPEGFFIVSDNQLLIVNPTNQLMVYRLVPQPTTAVSVSVSENLISVPAGTSRTVTVDAASNVDGTQGYSVSVFSVDGKLVETIRFSETFEGKDVTSPIIILTIVLAIIFVVLLVVLIVLIGKKPKKTEEFGESYY